MKHTFRRLTALASAAVTLLSVAAIPASAYNVTSSNYTNLTYNYSLTYGGYCWSTAAQQNSMPLIKASFLNSRNKVTVKGAGDEARPDIGGTYSLNTRMCALLDTDVISRTRLQNTQQALNARKKIDKISAKAKKDGTKFGLKLEFQEDSGSNLKEFGLRYLNDYYLRNEFSSNMYLDDFTVNYTTGEYSGRLYFDDLYVAGMRVSSTDRITEFSVPVLTWDEEYDWPLVYVDFSGCALNPNRPVFEGMFDKIMTREEFDEYCELEAVGFHEFKRFEDYPILSGLTVNYNGCTTPYTTNAFRNIIYPETTGC